MGYIENPKFKKSGIVGCIPQTGRCPHECADCFFQSGRSYLEPLDENLPNMPTIEQVAWRLVRVNDGNDSSVDRARVMRDTAEFPLRFYNTSDPEYLEEFDAPVVLTLNPKELTDNDFWKVFVEPPPKNLMYVRVRTNTWNLESVVEPAVEYYTSKEVPVVLTFMAYFNEGVPEDHKHNYTFRQRTLNSYWAITTDAWKKVMEGYWENPWVHSCGRVEGERGTTKCRHCGNCHREFFATMERMDGFVE